MDGATEAPDVDTEQLSECPLCSSRGWRSLPVPGNWIGSEVFGSLQGKLGLVRCRKCSLVFTNPRPVARTLAAFYAGDTYVCHESAGSASAPKADYVLSKIEEHLPASVPRALLDFGAGGGGFMAYVRERGWNVRGFEPGRRGLESCLRAGLDVTDRFEDLPQAAFGLVTLHHVFEHLADPTQMLESLRPLLAPHGRLYIEVPNAGSLRARLVSPALSRRLPVDQRYRAFPIHLMYYTARTLRRMLAEAGWKVETSFTLGLGLDEFWVRPPASHMSGGGGATNLGSAPKRRLRHHLRDAFLALGVGENLAVIAYPEPR